jgi:hypothetical protein
MIEKLRRSNIGFPDAAELEADVVVLAGVTIRHRTCSRKEMGSRYTHATRNHGLRCNSRGTSDDRSTYLLEGGEYRDAVCVQCSAYQLLMLVGLLDEWIVYNEKCVGLHHHLPSGSAAWMSQLHRRKQGASTVGLHPH